LIECSAAQLLQKGSHKVALHKHNPTYKSTPSFLFFLLCFSFFLFISTHTSSFIAILLYTLWISSSLFSWQRGALQIADSPERNAKKCIATYQGGEYRIPNTN